MTTVYVDVLIGLNLFINYFLFLAVAKLTRFPLKNRRNLLASLLLSFGSLTILLPELHWSLDLLMRLCLASVGVFAAFGRQEIRSFLKLTGALFAATFAFGGIMLALWYLFKPAGLILRNGAVYYDVSPLLLTVSTLVAYGVLWLLRRYFRKPLFNTRATLHLQQNHRTLTVQAKLDTGFALRDLYGDRPVILLSPSAAEKLFSPKEMGYRLIPYETVGGTGLLKSGVCSRVLVQYDGKTALLEHVVAAVSPQEISQGYKALIGCDFIERMEWDDGKTQTKIASAVAETHGKAHRLHKRPRHLAAPLKQGGRAGADGTAERGG